MSRRSEIPEVDIVETEKVELKEPLLIFGFVGAGLVAQIAVNQIIDQLNMKEIAHVRSRYIPPSVVFIDGKLKHPFRVYSDEEGRLCVVLYDTPLLYPTAKRMSSGLRSRVKHPPLGRYLNDFMGILAHSPRLRRSEHSLGGDLAPLSG